MIFDSTNNKLARGAVDTSICWLVTVCEQSEENSYLISWILKLKNTGGFINTFHFKAMF